MPEIIKIGGIELKFLETKEGTDGGVDVFEMTVQPNAKVPIPHYHESWDVTVYGLSGTACFQVGGADVHIGPGETVFIRRGVVHGFHNTGSEPVKCLCILSPGVLGPGYFREMAALLASPPPDPVRLKETMLRHGLVPAPPAAS
jgi:quercetin dioxygenase-like cupin family protein